MTTLSFALQRIHPTLPPFNCTLFQTLPDTTLPRTSSFSQLIAFYRETPQMTSSTIENLIEAFVKKQNFFKKNHSLNARQYAHALNILKLLRECNQIPENVPQTFYHRDRNFYPVTILKKPFAKPVLYIHLNTSDTLELSFSHICFTNTCIQSTPLPPATAFSDRYPSTLLKRIDKTLPPLNCTTPKVDPDTKPLETSSFEDQVSFYRAPLAYSSVDIPAVGNQIEEFLKENPNLLTPRGVAHALNILEFLQQCDHIPGKTHQLFVHKDKSFYPVTFLKRPKPVLYIHLPASLAEELPSRTLELSFNQLRFNTDGTHELPKYTHWTFVYGTFLSCKYVPNPNFLI